MKVTFRKNCKLHSLFWMISFVLLERLLAFPFSLRYRVVAPPGKGITAQNAPNGQSKADNEAPLLKSFNGVGRTGRTKSATGRFERRNIFLIKSHEINTDIFHFFSDADCLPCEDSDDFLGSASSKSESFFAAKRRSA